MKVVSSYLVLRSVSLAMASLKWRAVFWGGFRKRERKRRENVWFGFRGGEGRFGMCEV